MCEENLGIQAGVHLIEGVRLIWGLLNTDFTVLHSSFKQAKGRIHQTGVINKTYFAPCRLGESIGRTIELTLCGNVSIYFLEALEPN